MWVVGQFASAFLLGLTGAMMPGPMMTVTAQHSASLGWLAGPAVVAGHAVLETVMVSAIALGAARFLTAPAFAGTIGLIGGLVLVYMGIGVVRAAGTTPEHERRIRTAHSIRPVKAGPSVRRCRRNCHKPEQSLLGDLVGHSWSRPRYACPAHFRCSGCGSVFHGPSLSRPHMVRGSRRADGHRRKAAPSGGCGDDAESSRSLHGGNGRLFHILRSRVPHRRLLA